MLQKCQEHKMTKGASSPLPRPTLPRTDHVLSRLSKREKASPKRSPNGGGGGDALNSILFSSQDFCQHKPVHPDRISSPAKERVLQVKGYLHL